MFKRFNFKRGLNFKVRFPYFYLLYLCKARLFCSVTCALCGAVFIVYVYQFLKINAMPEVDQVELGFLEKCEPWRVESRLFPSKVGGKPAWLSLFSVPDSERLKCENCQQIMIFLCQVYAPYNDDLLDKEILENNFHRTIFVFLCRNVDCNKHNSSDNIKVFRNSLRRDNEFYPAIPPEERPDSAFDITNWSNLCNLCGISAVKQCSRCKNVFYCCREHQVLDWKYGHKLNCSSGFKSQSGNNSNILFSEWELVTETEEIHNDVVNEHEELEEYERLKAEGNTGILADVAESELDAHATSEIDKVFSKFKKVVSAYPDQVIRYSRRGEPLLIAHEASPINIPDCELCRGPRQFEFQVMPQMLSMLKENNLDWGVLLVYTCKNSCLGTSINSYKNEFVWKQDVSLINNSL